MIILIGITLFLIAVTGTLKSLASFKIEQKPKTYKFWNIIHLINIIIFFLELTITIII